MVMGPRTVLITGAAGFMGRALCTRYRAEGWNVLGVDRQSDAGAQIAGGDISTRGPWQDRFDGVDLVVHTAALVSNTTPRDEAWQVNVAGTRNVVEAAAAARVQRLVHVSSVAVYSHDRPDHVDEQWPVRPGGDVYGDTKIGAEQVVWQAHAAGEVSATVVRPGDVYGPGSRPWTIIPIQMLAAGRVVLPANGRGTFNAIYIDDLIDALVIAADHDAAVGQVFNLTGGHPCETREFFAYYCHMLGIRPPRVAPTAVAVAVAAAVGTASRAVGRPSEANAATMRMLSAAGDVSIEKARRLLGWEPGVDLDEGMRRTEVWLRAEGHL